MVFAHEASQLNTLEHPKSLKWLIIRVSNVVFEGKYKQKNIVTHSQLKNQNRSVFLGDRVYIYTHTYIYG